MIRAWTPQTLPSPWVYAQSHCTFDEQRKMRYYLPVYEKNPIHILPGRYLSMMWALSRTDSTRETLQPNRGVRREAFFLNPVFHTGQCPAL